MRVVIAVTVALLVTIALGSLGYVVYTTAVDGLPQPTGFHHI